MWCENVIIDVQCILVSRIYARAALRQQMQKPGLIWFQEFILLVLLGSQMPITSWGIWGNRMRPTLFPEEIEAFI